MEIAAKYDPQNIESKWYEYWMEHNLFASKPNEKKPYTIVIPPPNVTGVLHMGHMLNNTIQDILIRRARMSGYNALWVPGTDHASIATEAKVVALLKEKGINKNDITREEFLKYAWEWKEKHGGIILQQLKKLGASCDWIRTKFTMDPDMTESVIDVFIDLYNKGKIYRGVKMVNWDPAALTAISDEEVIYQEVNSKLYYLRYQIEGENQFVTIATTRPETILGDTAVCVNPNDEHYTHLKGKRALVPLINRSVPIIYDEYVEMEFGTGALKVTPAHDINDYHLGNKHGLDSVNIFNDNGTLNENAQLLIGIDRFEAREAIVPLLEAAGNLVKVEEYVNKVGYSERTHSVIEPKLSMQWFCDMKEMAKPALKAVVDNEIRFFPEKLKNTYSHWMENVKDWCISRQLWWGQRIPAYYLPNRDYVIAKSAEQALELAKAKYPELNLSINDLKQDEDVLDTWFSSWLWPLSLFDGIRNPDNAELNYYYPTAVLVTAPEIIFFWVARMIMSGMEWKKEIPFKDVYFTGIVRDKQGRKMSKSLGNSPDPIELMNKYGADGVRMGMLLTSPAGNDLPFDESLCETGRNFCNKIWNAFRLIQGWEEEKFEQPKENSIAGVWFSHLLDKTKLELNDLFSKYRLSEALTLIYKLFWDDFCSWYLEIMKPEFGKPICEISSRSTKMFFNELLKLLHPFMPFITEELYHTLGYNNFNSIMIDTDDYHLQTPNYEVISDFETVKAIITNIRNIRASKNISPKEKLILQIIGEHNAEYNEVIIKLANVEIGDVGEKSAGTVSFMVGTTEYAVPIGNLINVEEEIKKIEAEIKYYEGFLTTVLKKLSNEKFVNGAPENVVALERKKQSDAEEKIKILKNQIETFSVSL